MRRALVLALAASLTAACLHFRDPGGSPRGTYDERIETYARLLRMEDRRYYDPLLVGRSGASPDPWLRAKTALACGRLKDVGASPYLPVALHDADPSVRRAGAFAIGLSGDARLARFLVPALGDADAETAANAAEALGKLGGDAAIAALIETATAPERGPRTAAALALFRFSEERVVRALSPVAQGAVPPLRTSAVYALARKPRPESAAALRQALGGSADVVPLAARGLGLLGDVESVPTLAALAGSSEPSTAIQALLALEKIGEKSALADAARTAALARAADRLPGVAVAALRALSRFRGDAGVAARLAELAERKGWRGQTALLSLARLEGDASRPRLEAALGAAELEPRLAAAEALGALSPRVAAELLARLLDDRSGRVRALALGSAAKETLDSRHELLVKALEDRERSVRAAALDAAAPFTADAALDRAWRRAYDDSFGKGAEADDAVSALDAAASRPTGGRELVEAHVEDRDALVRERARRLLVEKLGVTRTFGRVPVRTGRDLVDYRALARLANESVLAAEVSLARGGAFTIELAPEDAPMTVASFAALARKGFFEGNVIHRVVPDFVVQAGDPRGDGTGGPGYALRDEINPRRYVRAAVGMALSGPDTGGSQWFVTLSPQPHLDGGYTVFGAVSRGMEDVDRIEQDDVLAKITIVEKPREERPRGFVP